MRHNPGSRSIKRQRGQQEAFLPPYNTKGTIFKIKKGRIKMSETSNAELLQYAIENGMLNVELVQKQIDMRKKEELLEQHQFKIWQGKDGKWYTYLPDETKGRKLIKKNTRENVEQIVMDYYKEKNDNPSVETLFYQWINGKLEMKEISRGTYDRYEVDFKKYLHQEDNFSQRKIKTITEDDLEFFIRKTVAELRITAKAYSGLRTILLGIFKYAKKKKYITYSISAFMSDLDLSRRTFTKNVKNKEDQVYSEDEVPEMKNYLLSHQNVYNLGLLLLFGTGLRVGELAAIKKEDRVSRNLIHIQRTEVRYKGENGKYVYDVKDYPKSEAGDRYVIVPEDNIWILDKAEEISSGEYIFSKGKERIKTFAFRRYIEYACRDLGIRRKSPHKVRKTYGTLLLDSNEVDDSVIMEQMGHSDINCTRKYYYYSNKNKERRIEQINKAIMGKYGEK